MIAKQDKINMIEDDPNQFISDEENEFIIKEIRSWWMDFITEFIDTFDSFDSVLQVIEKLFISNKEEDESDVFQNQQIISYIWQPGFNSEEFAMKLKEAGIFWLGELVNILEEKIDDVQFSASNFIGNIIIPILSETSI